MAKKKSFLGLKLTYDAPATLSFSAVCILLFVISCFTKSDKIFSLLLTSPTMAGGQSPFMASSLICYLKLFLYSLSAPSGQILISNVIFILLLGPSMEERYGTVVIGIMMFVSSLFAGVLNACFCKYSLTGCSSIVFMMIMLNSFMSISKKKIPFSFVFVFVLFIMKERFDENPNASIGIIINVAGGLCGSLFAFLTSPKARASKKTEPDTSGTNNDATEVESRKTSFFNRGGLLNKANAYAEKKENKNNDKTMTQETVVGTLHFDD